MKLNKRYRKLKRIAPIWYRWFKQNRSLGYVNIATVSIVYATLNSFLTKLVANQADSIVIFTSALFYFLTVSLYIKVNAFGGKWGMVISIVGAALGFLIGAKLL